MPIRLDAHLDEAHRDQQWHKPVRVATTASITISTALNNGDTIDGVTLATGDRVLVKDQSTGSQNGIYIVGASPARAYDMLVGIQALGAFVYVINGTVNGGKLFKCTNLTLPTIGSTSLTFTEFSSGGGFDPGWFNVTDYGATGDGTTDDTSAIQDTIDAAAAARGGTVYFPAGEYLVSGALQDTGAFNGQLLLPDVDHADPHITIEFRGALRPGFHPVYGSDPLDDTGYSIIRSSLTGASGTASVISGGNDLGIPSSGHGNNLEIYVTNLVCIGPDNPTFTFWNLSACQGGGVDALQISTPGAFAGTPTQPTNTNAYGIKLPQIYFANYVKSESLSVGGFYTGVLDGELCIHKGLILGPLIYGIEFPETFYPSLVIDMTSTSVQRTLHPTGDHRVDILQYTMEHSTSPSWAVTVYDLDDASDHLYGYIRWWCAATGGTPDHTFTINGGANAGNQEMGADWGTGSGTSLTLATVFDGTYWLPLVDGDGNAIMIEV